MREPSIGPMMAVSGLVHFTFLALVLYLFSFETNRTFVAPYVQVELLGPGIRGENRSAKPTSPLVVPPKPKEPPKVEAKRPAEPLEALKPKPKQEAVPKDSMLLPDKLQKAKPKAKVVPEKPKREKPLRRPIRPAPKIEPKSKERQEESLDPKLESAIERIRQRLAQQSSSGGVPYGAFVPGSQTGQPVDVRLARYISEVWQRLMLSFRLPPMLGETKGLEAIAVVRIGRSGEALAVSMEKGSGIPVFDEAVIRAIKESAPFPPLPEAIEGSFFELGVRFRPEDMG